MSAGRIMLAAAVAALLVLLGVGLAQLAGSSRAPGVARLTAAQMRRELAGSPPALAALHAQAAELLPGGLAALRARLQALHGRPVVLNKWASWCVPCRNEFGAFRHAALAQGRRVAFIGIDSGDSDRGEALAFLRTHAVPYPSYYDPEGAAGAALTDSSFTPVSVFYDARGRQYIHQGPYASAQRLEQDVARYALDEA